MGSLLKVVLLDGGSVSRILAIVPIMKLRLAEGREAAMVACQQRE